MVWRRIDSWPRILPAPKETRRVSAFKCAVAGCSSSPPADLELAAQTPRQPEFLGTVRDRQRGKVDDIAPDILQDRHRRRTAARTSVNPVREHNDEEVALGIDPHRCSGEAGMSERAWREVYPAAPAATAGLPSEAAPSLAWSRELTDGAVGDERLACRHAVVEHQLRKDGEVAGGGKEARVAGHTA